MHQDVRLCQDILLLKVEIGCQHTSHIEALIKSKEIFQQPRKCRFLKITLFLMLASIFVEKTPKQ